MGTLLPAAYGLAAGIPEPRIQDEFSYLLSADTFAHGRLTNPAPALPNFFEAPHVLVVPTYSSKYPPGQGLAMALGQVLGGHPIWGVWLSCGLFAASLCWMLQAWTSRPWALATTVVAMTTLGVSGYWAQSYWGGMVAATGGSLLFGGMRRTLAGPGIMTSVLTGLGVLLLANTRPYEGLLVCVPAALIFAWWVVRSHRVPLKVKFASWMLPFGAVLLMGGACMTVHNRAVTGEWFLFPHDLHTKQYFHQGLFLFSSRYKAERAPVSHIAKFYALYEYAPRYGPQLITTTAKNFYIRFAATVAWATLGLRGDARKSYLGVVLWILGLPVISLSYRSTWFWFCGSTVFFVVLGQSLVWWWYPHYAAPLVSVLLAAAAMTLSRIASLLEGFDWRAKFAPATVVLLAGILVLAQFPALSRLMNRGTKVNAETRRVASVSALSQGSVLSRSEAIRRLARQGGTHLVFVRYEDDVSPGRQWVQNAADLNSTHVMFAHDLSGENNPALVAAYPGRSVWLARLSKRETQLEPYSTLGQLTRGRLRAPTEDPGRSGQIPVPLGRP